MTRWTWKRIISSSIITVLLCLNISLTAHAETDEDLLEVYGKSSNSAVKQDIAAQINQYETTIQNLEMVSELNEIYNTMTDNYNEYQREYYSKIQNTVQEYADDNNEIKSKFKSDIETMSIKELMNMDNEYKSNISRMNDLISSMNNVHFSTDYLQTDYDLSDLYNNIDMLTKEYESAVDATEIGDVHSIQWIVNEPYYVTSNYGYRIDPITGSNITFHSGTDFRCPENTEVRALFSGKVIDVGYSKSSGNYVTIQSSDKIKYFICHLNKSLVSKDDYVNQYDVIALSGSTGARSTGPHLHLALFINGATYDVTKLFTE